MISAFGVEHTEVSKLALKTATKVVAGPGKHRKITYKPKGVLRKVKTGAVNVTSSLGGSSPTPAAIALRSVTPLRTVLSA